VIIVNQRRNHKFVIIAPVFKLCMLVHPTLISNAPTHIADLQQSVSMLSTCDTILHLAVLCAGVKRPGDQTSKGQYIQDGMERNMSKRRNVRIPQRIIIGSDRRPETKQGIDHDVLLSRLNHSFGVAGVAHLWIKTYLSDRS